MSSIFFYKAEGPHGYLSQWYASTFTDGKFTYNCAEQYMMIHKATTFGDENIEAKIKAEQDPKKQKAMGKRVKGFDATVWDESKFDVVEKANYLKFTQNADIKELLLETGDTELVEASRFDAIWGIGFSPSKAPKTDRSLWGQNLLGKALMKVRDRIRQEESKSPKS